VGESTFTIDDARRAKLAARDVWQKYPKDMLRSRAITRGARTYCPDVFNGAIYTAEEITAEIEPAAPASEPEMKTVTPTPAVKEAMPALAAPADIESDLEDVEAYRKALNYVRTNILGLDDKSTRPQHQDAIQYMATALGVPPPTSWKGFTIDQLLEFTEQYEIARAEKELDAATEPDPA
jgi:hypothetical protein